MNRKDIKTMKYEKLGYGITVAIKNNYLIRANILKVRDCNNTYDFTLELSQKALERFVPFSDTDIYRMESENINSDVADYILKCDSNGDFDSFIQIYEDSITYEMFGQDIMTLANTFSERTNYKAEEVKRNE